MARIEEEQQVKKEVFASSAKEPEWHGAFEAPADVPTSGVFGSFRLYNGVKRNQHTGLDFRVPTGTPVHASNAGTVILARPLYFEGNCVAVDHGQGLITLYFHLSEFKVKEGEKVNRGQLVALSGGTGRLHCASSAFCCTLARRVPEPSYTTQAHAAVRALAAASASMADCRAFTPSNGECFLSALLLGMNFEGNRKLFTIIERAQRLGITALSFFFSIDFIVHVR